MRPCRVLAAHQTQYDWSTYENHTLWKCDNTERKSCKDLG